MSRRRKILLGLLFLGVGLYVYLADTAHGPILPCMFNRMTGLYDPGCGMTRAVHHILRLDFGQALSYNLLIFLIPPLLIVYYYLKHRRMEGLARLILIFSLILALAYGILRNLPAFEYLAPGKMEILLR